jgi:hypothetical protein
MTVIATSDQLRSTGAPNQRNIDRTSNGVLWATFLANSTAPATNGALKTSYSTDGGNTWQAGESFFKNSEAYSYDPNASLFIDIDDYAHLVYRIVNSGVIGYRRGTPNAGRTAYTWSAETIITLAYQAGPAGPPDVVAHREGTGWVAHVVGAWPSANGNYNIRYGKVTITSGGTITASTDIAISNVTDTTHPANWGHPSIDFNHTGDGKTVAGNTPHLYVAWSNSNNAGGIKFKKATYSSGTWTWAAEVTIDSARNVADTGGWINCFFDGTRVVIAGMTWNNGSANYDLIVYDRDIANTTTTTKFLQATVGNNQYFFTGSATYDKNGNVYFFGRDTPDGTTYQVDYAVWNRATGVLGSHVLIDASTTNTPYVSVKRGNSFAKVDFVYKGKTGAPYDVVYSNLTLNQVPTQPTGFSIVPTPGNSSSVTISWTHNDPDGDPQTAYKIKWRPMV